MKRIKFIESLNIKELPYYNHKTVTYQRYHPNHTNIKGDYGGFIETEERCETVVVPVHQINHCVIDPEYRGDPSSPNAPIKQTETYIAYSEEVEELLDMPFKYLNEEVLRMRKRREEERQNYYKSRVILGGLRIKIKTATFWTRLKYLFTSKL